MTIEERIKKLQAAKERQEKVAQLKKQRDDAVKALRSLRGKK
jgi:hypothetical protein